MILRANLPGLLMAFGLALAAPLPVMAAGDVAEQVTQQLVDQGYDRIEVHRTLLGKVVVTATGRGHQREIVIDPRNGALLRDLVRDGHGGTESVGLAVVEDDDNERSRPSAGSHSGSGSGGSDDDSASDDDDSDDDSGRGSDDGSDDDSDSDSDSDNDSGSDDDDD